MSDPKHLTPSATVDDLSTLDAAVHRTLRLLRLMSGGDESVVQIVQLAAPGKRHHSPESGYQKPDETDVWRIIIKTDYGPDCDACGATIAEALLKARMRIVERLREKHIAAMSEASRLAGSVKDIVGEDLLA